MGLGGEASRLKKELREAQKDPNDALYTILAIGIPAVITIIAGIYSIISGDISIEKQRINSNQTIKVVSDEQSTVVKVGNYIYSIPDHAEVKDTESESYSLSDDKTCICDDYIVRSYYIDGVNVQVKDAVNMLYPELIPVSEVWGEKIKGESITYNTADTKGNTMYAENFFFLDGLRLYSIAIFSYDKNLNKLEDEIFKTLREIDKSGIIGEQIQTKEIHITEQEISDAVRFLYRDDVDNDKIRDL